MRNNQRSHWFLAFQDELDWFSFAQKTNAELIGLKMPENQAQSIENLKIYNDLTRVLIRLATRFPATIVGCVKPVMRFV